MRNDFYPPGTVENLLQTDLVTPQTKKVLRERLAKPIVTEPSFFSKAEFATLGAVCKRLLPQPEDRAHPVDLAGILDTNFKEDRAGNGWRFDAMPPDETAFHAGLQYIEATAQQNYKTDFCKLSGEQQDALLQQVQENSVDKNIWKNLSSSLFFQELLSMLAEIYYSHPVGRNEIGDVSFADTPGWHQIQLNEREEREPKTE